MEKYEGELNCAIKDHSYDSVTCRDFEMLLPKEHKSVSEVETLCHRQLFSQNLQDVKDGLSNAVSWSK